MWVARRRRSLLFRLSSRGLLALVLWYCKCYFEGWYTVYNKTCFEGGVPGRRLLGGAEDALCHPLAPFKFLKSIIFNSSWKDNGHKASMPRYHMFHALEVYFLWSTFVSLFNFCYLFVCLFVWPAGMQGVQRLPLQAAAAHCRTHPEPGVMIMIRRTK